MGASLLTSLLSEVMPDGYIDGSFDVIDDANPM
jgi:hypothetical protein